LRTSTTGGGKVKRVFGSAGLGLLILALAYYAWSSNVVNVSHLKSGKEIEIRATNGNIHIVGTQGNDVHVTIQDVDADAAKTAHMTIDRNRNPVLVEIKDLPKFATASVEVPRAANLAISMLAGNLQIEEVDGDKRCLLRSGKMLINVGNPQAYKSVRAFVFAGGIQAPAFNRDTGGVGRMITWTGPGQAVIDVHVSAGLLVLR
jgi:predicted secreted protein